MEKTDWDYEDEFDVLSKKHGLPNFETLAEDFDIEKLIEKETAFLAREIRRIMVEKFSAYLHLFETLINPSSTSMFVFSALRNQSVSDKEKVREIYKKLSKIQLKVMQLDTIYNEEAEIEFINEYYEKWQDFKLEIQEILKSLDENYDNGSKSLERGYFG